MHSTTSQASASSVRLWQVKLKLRLVPRAPQGYATAVHPKQRTVARRSLFNRSPEARREADRLGRRTSDLPLLTPARFSRRHSQPMIHVSYKTHHNHTHYWSEFTFVVTARRTAAMVWLYLHTLYLVSGTPEVLMALYLGYPFWQPRRPAHIVLLTFLCAHCCPQPRL